LGERGERLLTAASIWRFLPASVAAIFKFLAAEPETAIPVAAMASAAVKDAASVEISAAAEAADHTAAAFVLNFP
jgi:hypothetical protein